MSRKVFRTVFLLICAVHLSCMAGEQALRDIPSDRIHEVRIIRILDPRLPRLSDSEFNDMLRHLQAYIKEYLGYDARFTRVPDIDLLRFRQDMAFIENLDDMKVLKQGLLDITTDTDRRRLRDYIRTLVHRTDKKILASYVPDYATYKNPKRLAEHLYTRYVAKLQAIQEIRTADGTALHSSAYKDTLTYPFWEMALRHLQKADFVFTNTIMADAETDIPIYVVLRYGITTGMVTGNNHNSFKGAGIMFTFPFLSQDKFFVKERKEQIPGAEKARVIALYSTHEFGHLLNHFKDYYDHRNCIMVPANDLNYYRWYRERREGRCTLTHEKLQSF
ncbi:MAG TPA: hypothetical protein PK200_06980 [Spirochaetota bacterium]|nr:hypothetical protein [Spirochaetota bacterium]